MGAVIKVDFLRRRINRLREELEARANPAQARAVRKVVKEARTYVRQTKGAKSSPAMRRRYARTAANMFRNRQMPEHAKTKADYALRRAALIHVAIVFLKKAVAALASSKRKGDLSAAADVFNAIRSALGTLHRYNATELATRPHRACP